MKMRRIIACWLLGIVPLLACTFAGAATPESTSPTEPGRPAATLPPLAPGTLLPTWELPTATPAKLAPTLSVTATPTPTATLLTPTATQPPVSTGPLAFTIGIVGCRLDPSREGGVILKMQFDAQGGNGIYTYYRENKRVERIFERPATKGTAVIDSYRVESGDGQQLDKKERFTGSQFGCP